MKKGVINPYLVFKMVFYQTNVCRQNFKKASLMYDEPPLLLLVIFNFDNPYLVNLFRFCSFFSQHREIARNRCCKQGYVHCISFSLFLLLLRPRSSEVHLYQIKIKENPCVACWYPWHFNSSKDQAFHAHFQQNLLRTYSSTLSHKYTCTFINIYI